MLTDLRTALRPALAFALLCALLLGIAYPLALTGIGQALFPRQANGSLIREGARIVGAEPIGQRFAAARYFHGRPSAAGTGYDPTASAGSNLGATSRALVARVTADVAAARRDAPGLPVPADLATASGSGLDPDIAPVAAAFQAARVARARGLPTARVAALVAAQTQGPLFGFVGEPRVNVLRLNRALDRIGARP